jgi:hypothetical protein
MIAVLTIYFHRNDLRDKLFFFQLFGKVDDITMSTIPMYHVNRYDENKSLVQQSSMLDSNSI